VASTTFASVAGLGALRSEHKPSTSERILSRVFTAVGLVMVVLPVAVFATGLVRPDDAVWLLITPVVGGTFTMAGLLLLFKTRRSPLAVAVYEGGFAYTDRMGLQQVPWSEIDFVWQDATRQYFNSVYAGTSYVYTIQLRDKKRVVLNTTLSRIEDLGKAITVGSSNALFPRYVAALKSGVALDFGPIGLDTAGVWTGKKTLKWSEIKAVKIKEGIISIKQEGGWFNWTSFTVSDVPNFWIFLELLRRLTNVE
jgi:hypothetical protein